MRTTVAVLIASAAFLLPMGPTATRAWAQPQLPQLNVQDVTTRVFGMGLLTNGMCYGANAVNLNVSDSNGPVLSSVKGHLCFVNNCTVQEIPTLCATQGATVLDCTIMTTATDCSSTTFVCTDPTGGPQTFHTLGLGKAVPTKPTVGAPFVDGVPVVLGVVNIFHQDSANPSADCGQRLIGRNGSGN
jgi:hypothetical protein